VDGMIFDVMRYSVKDGPGIRTTVFLKGCPLDCWWCHNPEGKPHVRQIMVFSDRCIGCGACRAVCSHDAVTGLGECVACGECAEACYADARVLVGRRVSPEQLLAEVMRDRVFYDQSSGGVTFSGGEPLAQPGFLRDVLLLCKKEGIHTAVDTSGYCDRDVLMSIQSLVDLFLFDIKMVDEAAHIRYTGVPFSPVGRNLQALLAAGKDVVVRIPLIPGVNDSEGSLAAIAAFLVEMGGVQSVAVLPYHSSGTAKYDRLGSDYRLEGLANATEEDVASAVRILKGFGLNAGGFD
jgi:pyruvate formate lyase activating enzyme